MQSLFEVIYEDTDVLAINKPAGLVCHPTKTDSLSSLIGRIRIYSGGSTKPHLINRLDRETSGVVLVAKNAGAARELRRIWENRAVRKEYLAIVHGHVAEVQGMIDAPLGKDERSRVAIKNCVRLDGAPSKTEFQVKQRFIRPEGRFTLLQVVPQTGRKHQIRIHLAHAGHPLVGDKLYGGDESLYLDFVQGRLEEGRRRQLILPFHALHAGAARFAWRDQERSFCAEPEAWFQEFSRGSLA